MNNPITVIDGKAGAGKTDLLYSLHKIYGPNEIIACAWQGTNIARLAEMFPGCARTVHMTLFEHYKHCPRSPYTAQKKTGEGFCQFEKCRILIIDEGLFHRNDSFISPFFSNRFYVVSIPIVQITIMCSSLFNCD